MPRMTDRLAENASAHPEFLAHALVRSAIRQLVMNPAHFGTLLL